MLQNLGNINKFKVMSVLVAALYFYLFVSLLLFTESACRGFGLIGSESLYFFARRASALMLGFSSLLFLSRNALPSVARQTIAFSVGLNMAGFALSSIHGLITGFAVTSVFVAFVAEIFIAAVYFGFWFSDRSYLRRGRDSIFRSGRRN
jgi:hypothetical protein